MVSWAKTFFSFGIVARLERVDGDFVAVDGEVNLAFALDLGVRPPEIDEHVAEDFVEFDFFSGHFR